MLKLEAEELKTVEKSDVIDWYKKYLRRTSPRCRQLAIHVWGCNKNAIEGTEKPSKFGKVVEDLDSLKSSSEFYSSEVFEK